MAASRSDHPHHRVARAWLEQALASAENGGTFTLMPMVLASTLRLLTSAKIFVRPTPTADAWLAAAVEQLGEHLVSFDRNFRKLLSRSRFTHLNT